MPTTYSSRLPFSRCFIAIALGLAGPALLACAAAPESPSSNSPAATASVTEEPAQPQEQPEIADDVSFSAGSDERISASILAKLKQESDLDLGKVEVATDKGVVTLSGLVADSSARNSAASIADEATGVLGVVNDLDVEVAPQ